MKQPDNHFFASSAATWRVTTPDCDLREMLRLMDAEGYDYNLFLVPGPHDAPYEIRQYAPQVEGTQRVGYFKPIEPKSKKPRR